MKTRTILCNTLNFILNPLYWLLIVSMRLIMLALGIFLIYTAGTGLNSSFVNQIHSSVDQIIYGFAMFAGILTGIMVTLKALISSNDNLLTTEF